MIWVVPSSIFTGILCACILSFLDEALELGLRGSITLLSLLAGIVGELSAVVLWKIWQLDWTLMLFTPLLSLVAVAALYLSGMAIYLVFSRAGLIIRAAGRKTRTVLQEWRFHRDLDRDE